MKILHIVKTATGATWVYHQVRVLRSLGFEIVVALPSATAGLAPKYQEAGATVIPSTSTSPPATPANPRRTQILPSPRSNPRAPPYYHHHVGTTLEFEPPSANPPSSPASSRSPGPFTSNTLSSLIDTSSAGPQDHWIGRPVRSRNPDSNGTADRVA